MFQLHSTFTWLNQSIKQLTEKN